MNAVSNNGNRLLLIDHACHATTHSVDFLHTILRHHFNFSTHYYNKAYRLNLPAKRIAEYDYFVFFEFLPGRLRQFFPQMRQVYFPMYDNEWGSKWCWRRIALTGMPVVSFCSRVTDFAKKHGVKNVLDVKFFPDPNQYKNMRGDPRILLLWERGQIDFTLVKGLFAPGDMKEIILLRHPEEKISHATISEEELASYNVRIVEIEYLPRDRFLETLRSAGTIIAPRKREGIGMVFLEAMAMRKCVLAHHDATMNEYIKHRSNGFLFNADRPKRIVLDDLLYIYNNIPDPKSLHERWISDQEKIAPFVQSAKPVTLNIQSLLFYYFYYLLFLAETAYFKFSRKPNLFR
ncbi:MAG: glycosyltransferase [Bacteroidia bacterium]|nr:glycosyltransferase [Bacteroidia bacterium]